MEQYTNCDWTQCQANAYIDEAAAWSENGNHAPFYCMGIITKRRTRNSQVRCANLT